VLAPVVLADQPDGEASPMALRKLGTVVVVAVPGSTAAVLGEVVSEVAVGVTTVVGVVVEVAVVSEVLVVVGWDGGVTGEEVSTLAPVTEPALPGNR
jgi:hypothetical protein